MKNAGKCRHGILVLMVPRPYLSVPIFVADPILGVAPYRENYLVPDTYRGELPGATPTGQMPLGQFLPA